MYLFFSKAHNIQGDISKTNKKNIQYLREEAAGRKEQKELQWHRGGRDEGAPKYGIVQPPKCVQWQEVWEHREGQDQGAKSRRNHIIKGGGKDSAEEPKVCNSAEPPGEHHQIRNGKDIQHSENGTLRGRWGEQWRAEQRKHEGKRSRGTQKKRKQWEGRSSKGETGLWFTEKELWWEKEKSHGLGRMHQSGSPKAQR